MADPVKASLLSMGCVRVEVVHQLSETRLCDPTMPVQRRTLRPSSWLCTSSALLGELPTAIVDGLVLRCSPSRLSFWDEKMHATFGGVFRFLGCEVSAAVYIFAV